MRSRPIAQNAPYGTQRFSDLRLDPLPRVPSILDPPRCDVCPKLGESPYSRTRTSQKELGFTWHESSPPDPQPYTAGIKLTPYANPNAGRWECREIPSLDMSPNIGHGRSSLKQDAL